MVLSEFLWRGSVLAAVILAWEIGRLCGGGIFLLVHLFSLTPQRDVCCWLISGRSDSKAGPPPHSTASSSALGKIKGWVEEPQIRTQLMGRPHHEHDATSASWHTSVITPEMVQAGDTGWEQP